MALTLAMLGAVTACQQEQADPGRARESVSPSPDDHGSLEAQAADYETWEPVYGEVRPATADDVESLRQRVLDLNETAYTAVVPLMGLEIASTPDHVRVRFGEGAPGGFDLHLDPTATSEAFFGPFVICSADDGSCVEVGEEGPKGGSGPHMFNNGMDTVIFWASGIVSTQHELPDSLPDVDADASVTTVESPYGTLDCLLTGSTPEQRGHLEGKPVDQEADPITRDGDPEPLSTLCVDERGLVVVTLPSLAMGVVPYGSVEDGVPDDFDDHADPRPYGSSPSVSPSSAPSTPEDPDETVSVLMVVSPIDAGETVGDAQMTGRIEFEFVPARDLLPGAVSDLNGRGDEVAMTDLAAGDQIVGASFGVPTRDAIEELGVTPELYRDARRVAARNGYGPAPGVAPGTPDMLVLAFQFAHRCSAAGSDKREWFLAAWDDSSGLGPDLDEATRLNDYLRDTWCAAVLR